MTGNIRNRNVRFYEEKEADRRAWEILHSEAVRAFPSQNDFIIQAINDFYDRHLAISDDPYLETREKEDAFADRIVEGGTESAWQPVTAYRHLPFAAEYLGNRK